MPLSAFLLGPVVGRPPDETVDRVVLITPKIIHTYSFIYEPIIDMSDIDAEGALRADQEPLTAGLGQGKRLLPAQPSAFVTSGVQSPST